ncbi:MAG: hypothetical protein ACKVQK_24475 [Burkholderiales bacterium]
MLKAAAWILWPSFLTACVGEVLFFALFDPAELVAFFQGDPPSRIAVYSIGFFFFWFLATISSGLTWMLVRQFSPADHA